MLGIPEDPQIYEICEQRGDIRVLNLNPQREAASSGCVHVMTLRYFDQPQGDARKYPI